MTASQAEQIAGVRPILKRVVANAGKLLGGRTVNALLGVDINDAAAPAGVTTRPRLAFSPSLATLRAPMSPTWA